MFGRWVGGAPDTPESLTRTENMDTSQGVSGSQHNPDRATKAGFLTIPAQAMAQRPGSLIMNGITNTLTNKRDRANDDEEEDSLPANTTQFGSVKMRAVAGTKRIAAESAISQLKVTQTTIAALEESLEDRDNQLRDNTEDLNRLNDRLKTMPELESRIESLTAERNGLLSKMADVENECSLLRQERDELKSQLSEMKIKMDDIERTNASMQQDLSSVTQENLSIKTDMKEQGSQLRQLLQDFATFKADRPALATPMVGVTSTSSPAAQQPPTPLSTSPQAQPSSAMNQGTAAMSSTVTPSTGTQQSGLPPLAVPSTPQRPISSPITPDAQQTQASETRASAGPTPMHGVIRNPLVPSIPRQPAVSPVASQPPPPIQRAQTNLHHDQAGSSPGIPAVTNLPNSQRAHTSLHADQAGSSPGMPSSPSPPQPGQQQDDPMNGDGTPVTPLIERLQKAGGFRPVLPRVGSSTPSRTAAWRKQQVVPPQTAPPSDWSPPTLDLSGGENPSTWADLPQELQPVKTRLEAGSPDMLRILAWTLDQLRERARSSPSTASRKYRSASKKYTAIWVRTTAKATKALLTTDDHKSWNNMVRAILYGALDITRGYDVENNEPAPLDAVAAFAAGDETADPLTQTGEKILLDFGVGWRTSPWNHHIIVSLSAVLCDSGRTAGLPDVSTDYLEAALMARFETLRGYYTATSARIHRTTGEAETEEQIEERLTTTATLRERRDQYRIHRDAKFKKRIATIEIILSIATTLNHECKPLWEYVHRVLMRLGKDAMSDEEPEVQRASTDPSVLQLLKTRRILQPAFRLREFTKIFLFLDNARIRAELQSSMPSARAVPTRSPDVNHNQPPPQDTPFVYLDSAWLAVTPPHLRGSPNMAEVWTVPSVDQMEKTFTSLLGMSPALSTGRR